MRRNSPTNPVWLLDANIDIRVRQILAEYGVESQTAESLGWKRLSNGNLVAAAIGGGFTCLVTRDQLFVQSAGKTLKCFLHFAIVIVNLRQQRWQAYGDSFRREWAREEIRPIPGKAVSWPR